MRNLFSAITASTLLLYSCGGGESNSTSTEKDTLTADSVVVIDLPAEIDSLLADFIPAPPMPVNLDSALIAGIESKDSLPGRDVRFLAANYHSHSLFEFQSYPIENFLKIDSIKIAGGYPDYVESLDIGMTKESKAFRLFHLQLNDSSLLFFWAIHYHTYEACPWGNGNYVYMTHIHSGRVKETICIALMDAGGDPPVGGSTDRFAELKEDGTFHIYQRDISDEDNEQPKVELTEGEYDFAIRDSSIVPIKEKPGKPKMVKRETVGY